MVKREKFTHLTAQERAFIEIRLDDGFKLRAIARSFNRSPGTLSREVKRNGCTVLSNQSANTQINKTAPNARKAYLTGYCRNRSQASAKRLAGIARRPRLLLQGMGR